MRYLIALVITVALFVAAFALSANAHARAELDEWKADWARATARGVTLDGLTAYQEMMARHPWYFVRDISRNLAAYRGMGAGVEAWRPLVAAWFPPGEVDRALCIVEHESGGNPDAHSATDDYGLFQIHAPIWSAVFNVTPADLYEPSLNVSLARRIYDAQGWTAWSAWNRGRCA